MGVCGVLVLLAVATVQDRPAYLWATSRASHAARARRGNTVMSRPSEAGTYATRSSSGVSGCCPDAQPGPTGWCRVPVPPAHRHPHRDHRGLTSPEFLLRDPSDRNARVAGWGRVLAAATRTGAVRQVQLLEQSIDDGSTLASYTDTHLSTDPEQLHLRRRLPRPHRAPTRRGGPSPGVPGDHRRPRRRRIASQGRRQEDQRADRRGGRSTPSWPGSSRPPGWTSSGSCHRGGSPRSSAPATTPPPPPPDPRRRRRRRVRGTVGAGGGTTSMRTGRSMRCCGCARPAQRPRGGECILVADRVPTGVQRTCPCSTSRTPARSPSPRSAPALRDHPVQLAEGQARPGGDPDGLQGTPTSSTSGGGTPAGPRRGRTAGHGHRLRHHPGRSGGRRHHRPRRRPPRRPSTCGASMGSSCRRSPPPPCPSASPWSPHEHPDQDDRAVRDQVGGDFPAPASGRARQGRTAPRIRSPGAAGVDRDGGGGVPVPRPGAVDAQGDVPGDEHGDRCSRSPPSSCTATG